MNSLDSESQSNFIKMEFGNPCIKCGILTFNNEMVAVHNGAHMVGYRCPICPQVFMTKHIFDLHMFCHKRDATNFVEDYCQCKLCCGAFLNLCYLEMHLLEFHSREIMLNPNVVHSGNSAYEDKSSRTFDDFQKEKLFKCGTCNDQFVYGLNLDCHMAVHDNCIYSCAKCSRSYLSLDGLTMHLKSKHETQESSANSGDEIFSSKIPDFPMSFPSKSQIFVVGDPCSQSNISKLPSYPMKLSTQAESLKKVQSSSASQLFRYFLNLDINDDSVNKLPNPEETQLTNKYLSRINYVSTTPSSPINSYCENIPDSEAVSLLPKKTVTYVNPFLFTIMDTAKPTEM